MLDPVSVAGLALAIFDELLKLGTKTAQLAAEMRSFDNVSISTTSIIRLGFKALIYSRTSNKRAIQFASKFGGWMDCDSYFGSLL